MVAKAKALKEAAMDRPGSSGNEGGPSEDVSENEADNREPSLSSRAVVRGAESLQDGASSITHVDDTLPDDKADHTKDHGMTDDGNSDDGEVAQGAANSELGKMPDDDNADDDQPATQP